MNHLLVRQKSSNFLRQKQSEFFIVSPSIALSSTTLSDQKPREVKSASYQNARYKLLLLTKDSFMNKSNLEITETSKETYLNLLNTK